MFIRRGDVVLVDFDPAQNFEAASTRPAVVVSNNSANDHAHVVIVVPLTSDLARIYPHEMILPTHRVDIDRDSKTQVHLLRHVSKARIVSVIASLPEDLLLQLDDLLREHLAL
jgi:mRNA interferase MazF